MYRIDVVAYNDVYKVIGKHPDGRILAVKHGNINGLYVVDKDLALVETLSTTLDNSDPTLNGYGINECVILSTGTMLCWGIYRSGSNVTKIWRSTDTSYSTFTEVFALPDGVMFIENSVAVSVVDDTIMCCEYTTNPVDPETGYYSAPFELNMWRGTNDGQTWSVVQTESRVPLFTGDVDRIRHFHAVRYDPYENLFWITSGDWSYECSIWTIKPDGTDLTEVLRGVDGENGQQYRTTSLMFTDDYVWWGSDASYETYHRFVRLERSTRTAVMLILPDDCIRLSTKIHHPSGDILLANKSYEKTASNLNKTTEIYLCDNLISGKWYSAHTWNVASESTVSMLYQVIDNLDGRIFAYCRRIIDESGTQRILTTAVIDLVESQPTSGSVSLRSSSGTIDIPVYDPDIVTDGDSRLRVKTDSGVRCFVLDAAIDVNIPVLKIKTQDGIYMITGEYRT